MTRRIASRRIVLSTTFLMLAAGGTAACDTATEDPNEDGVFYCTNAEGVVIDEDYCNEDSENYNSGMFFMYMGSSMHYPPSGSTYSTGNKLPTGAQRFSVTDSTARQRFGLPARGRVSNGTIKRGVVGKGGPGSTARNTGSGGKVGGGSGSKGGGSSGGG